MKCMDREKITKGLEVRIISDTDKGYKTIEIPVNEAENIVALLKEQEWHIFHENEDGVMDVECIPNNGEEFLWYRKHSGDMIVAPWGDDDWAEYACTADGESFEDGDAWMELPKPPKQ